MVYNYFYTMLNFKMFINGKLIIYIKRIQEYNCSPVSLLFYVAFTFAVITDNYFFVVLSNIVCMAIYAVLAASTAVSDNNIHITNWTTAGYTALFCFIFLKKVSNLVVRDVHI